MPLLSKETTLASLTLLHAVCIEIFNDSFFMKIEIRQRKNWMIIAIFWSYKDRTENFMNSINALWTIFIILNKLIGLPSRLQNFLSHVYHSHQTSWNETNYSMWFKKKLSWKEEVFIKLEYEVIVDL